MDRPPIDQPTDAALRPPGTRLHDYARSELASAIARLAWRGSHLHMGVHQARKSLRRARATLALGMPVLGPGADLIDRELRRVNRSLSRLRDAHALVAALDAALAQTDTDASVGAALLRARRRAALARATCARKALALDPALRNRRDLLATLLPGLAALHWDALDTEHVDAALQSSRLRADAAGAKAWAGGDDEDWHRWRRRMRRLSQQQRAIGTRARGDPAVDAVARKRDKRLAILLGQAQDPALVGEHCGRKSPFAPPDREILRLWADQVLVRLRARITQLAGANPSAE
jgi:hypothetical protein